MIKQIESKEMFQMKQANQDFILIDCRELEEWKTAHIEFANFIPLSSFETGWSTFISEQKVSKGSKLIIQCRSGKRSMKVCEYLATKGYTDLTNLSDGILGWQANQFPMIGDGIIT